MAPSPASRTAMTGSDIAILVVCVIIFTILLAGTICLGYRSDKRRAEYALQFPRTPTPTAARTLSSPAAMAEVPQRQAPKSADESASNGPWVASRRSGEVPAPSVRPQKAVPQPGAMPTRSSLSSRNGANGGTRPQTAVSAGGSAGVGSFHAGSFHAGSFHGGGGSIGEN